MVQAFSTRGLTFFLHSALRNAGLFEAERQRREETSLVLEVTRAVNSTLLLDEVLQLAANSIARAVGVPSCGIYLLDETGTRLVPRKGSESALSALIRGVFMSTPLEIGPDRFLSEVMETKRPTICATPKRTHGPTKRSSGSST